MTILTNICTQGLFLLLDHRCKFPCIRSCYRSTSYHPDQMTVLQMDEDDSVDYVFVHASILSNKLESNRSSCEGEFVSSPLMHAVVKPGSAKAVCRRQVSILQTRIKLLWAARHVYSRCSAPMTLQMFSPYFMYSRCMIRRESLSQLL